MIFFIVYKTLSYHETKTNKENSNVRSESWEKPFVAIAVKHPSCPNSQRNSTKN